MLELRFNILIVDDEPRQRRGVAALLRELRPNDQIHEAKNGKEALDICLHTPIDIVFTDIQMPVMNGLEYIQALKEQCSSLPQIILVTVYDEFTYVQQAIRLGVTDYMVKPVTASQLLPLLAQIEQTCIRESQEKVMQQNLYQQLEKSLPVYREHLLYRWLTSSLTNAEQQECNLYFPDEGEAEIWIMESQCNTEQQDQIWRISLIQALPELMNQANVFTVCSDTSDQQLIVIVHYHPQADRDQQKQQVDRYLEEMEQSLSCCIRVGESSAFLLESILNNEQAKSAYRRAFQALEKHFYHPNITRWMMVNELVEPNEKYPVFQQSNHYIQQIESVIYKKDVQQLAVLITQCIEQIADEEPPIEHFKYTLLQILLSALRASQHQISAWSVEDITTRIEHIIMQSTHMITMRQQIIDSISPWIIKQNEQDTLSKSAQAMMQCQVYLEQHYAEDLSLDTVAQHFFYNSSYFSILFKSNFGISFTDYVQRIRMQKARELLLQTDAKIAEIGRQTGYRDIKYFAKVFKKTFAHTPEEYRRYARSSSISLL